jgi:hypothetical protein
VASTEVRTGRSTGLGIAGLTLGLLSVMTFALLWLSVPLGMSSLGLGLVIRRRGGNGALGTAVIVVGCCALLVAVIVAVVLTPATVTQA